MALLSDKQEAHRERSTSNQTSSSSTSNSGVEIDKLFDYSRIARKNHYIPLVFYFPIGLILCLLRIFIGIQVFFLATLFPKASSTRCFILRSMCVVLGIVVKEIDPPSRKMKESTKLLVSNHLTHLDHLAIDLIHPCIAPSVWDLPKVLSWGLGFHDFGIHRGRDTLIDNVRKHLTSSDHCIPILAHPEGATTNGRVGLLKFSSWCFSLDLQVQPVCITLSRSLIRVAPSVFLSRWWSDLLWVLFVPYTVYTLKYLSLMKRNDDETPDEFAKRVQVTMASALRVNATNYSDADKIEFAKRLLHAEAHSQNSSASPNNTRTSSSTSSANTQRARPTSTSSSFAASVSSPRLTSKLEQMAKKVKEVLPQVPLSAIQRDLLVTANIDETITRILDGTVSYVAEHVGDNKSLGGNNASSSSSTHISGASHSPSEFDPHSQVLLNTAAKTFGKNANERHSSYQERKQALIENSRFRYLRKHGLINDHKTQ